MVTLKEISEKCGVSIATVSNILNGKTNVSEATKQRILKVIHETGYKPNFMAQRLRAHKTFTIGLITDDITEYTTPKIIDGIMNYCDEKGYRIVFENLRFYSKYTQSHNNADEYKKAVENAVYEMMSIKVDGIIYLAAHAHEVESLPDNLPIPVVIAYAWSSNEKFPYVLINDESSAYEMTNHLISKGHKKIAAILGEKTSSHTVNRLKGYEKALTENNIPIERNIIYCGSWNRESGYSSCKNLFESGYDFDAIFCFNDEMAAGVYDYMIENGKEPGKDIAIAGFDNKEVSRYLRPQLTTMELPLFWIGHTSAKAIIDLIDGNDTDGHAFKVPCKLVERESV